MAQSGHPSLHRTCPLLGVKRTSIGGLHFSRNSLFCNGTKMLQFVIKPLTLQQKDVTLNQRVQGSSPCAPTNLARKNKCKTRNQNPVRAPS
jgi:hypothetical protein